MTKKLKGPTEKTKLKTITGNESGVSLFSFIEFCSYIFISLSFLICLFAPKQVLFTVSRKGFSAISPEEFPHYFWVMFIMYGLITFGIFYRIWKKYFSPKFQQ